MNDKDNIIENNKSITINKEAKKNSEETAMNNKQTEKNQEQIANEQEAKIEKMTEKIETKMNEIEATMDKIEATIEGTEVGSVEYQKQELISNVSSLSAGLVLSVIGTVMLMKARKIEEKSKKKIVGWIMLAFGVATMGFSIAQLIIPGGF